MTPAEARHALEQHILTAAFDITTTSGTNRQDALNRIMTRIDNYARLTAETLQAHPATRTTTKRKTTT